MNQTQKHPTDERLTQIENRLDVIEQRLKNVELSLGILKNKDFHDNMSSYANAIYKLLKRYQGVPMSKKRIRQILGGSEHHFRQARKHLIEQGKMVDGTGTDLEAGKICNTNTGYVIFTAAEVQERLQKRAERKKRMETQ